MAHNPPVDVQEIAGNVPSAVNPLPVRLTDGVGFYVAGAGGGGGGAATIADGADVAQGATTDVVWVSGGNGSLIAINKYQAQKLEAIRALLAGSIAVTGTFWQATQPVSLATNTPDVIDRAARLLGHVTVDNASLAVTGPLTDTQLRATRVAVDPSGVTSPISAASLPLPTGAATETTLAAASAKLAGLGQKVMASSEAVVIASDQSAIPTKETPATLVGTTLGAANTAVTLTLNAVAAQFHYITSIEIVAINPTITAIAAAASNLAFTSTNLNGIAWNAGTLLAAGAEKVITRMQFGPPLRSAVVNTATTIVAPAIGAGGVVRITVTYYTAA